MEIFAPWSVCLWIEIVTDKSGAGARARALAVTHNHKQEQVRSVGEGKIQIFSVLLWQTNFNKTVIQTVLQFKDWSADRCKSSYGITPTKELNSILIWNFSLLLWVNIQKYLSWHTSLLCIVGELAGGGWRDRQRLASEAIAGIWGSVWP